MQCQKAVYYSLLIEVEEGGVNQEHRRSLETREGKETDSLPESPEGIKPLILIQTNLH